MSQEHGDNKTNADVDYDELPPSVSDFLEFVQHGIGGACWHSGSSKMESRRLGIQLCW